MNIFQTLQNYKNSKQQNCSEFFCENTGYTVTLHETIKCSALTKTPTSVVKASFDLNKKEGKMAGKVPACKKQDFVIDNVLGLKTQDQQYWPGNSNFHQCRTETIMEEYTHTLTAAAVGIASICAVKHFRVAQAKRTYPA